jgi:membrane protease subunit HflC
MPRQPNSRINLEHEMPKFIQAFLLLALVVTVVLRSTFFVVAEGQQAIITMFGKPVGDPIQEAGLKMKLPFVQEARFLERRILNWDGKPNQIPTKDKKYIYVDTTARWIISDPLQFIRSVQDERNARSRIDTIIESATRDIISGHNLVEAVRNSNEILEQISATATKAKERQAEGSPIDNVEEEITGEIERVSVGRERLSSLIFDRAQAELKELGIGLIDVQLRRIAYEDSVEKKVYERMISERQRIAAKIRSIGKGEQARIRGKTSRDLQDIESGAYRQVQEIRGEADAKAIRTYADAVGQDPEFFTFLKTLEVYQQSLRPDTSMILSTDAEFLELLQGAGKKGQEKQP